MYLTELMSVQQLIWQSHDYFFFRQNFTDSLVVSERCGTREELLLWGCPQGFMQFPVNAMELLADGPLGKNADTANVSYITPQRIALKLRPGKKSIVCRFDQILQSTIVYIKLFMIIYIAE